MEQGGENFVSIAAPHFCTYVFMFRWQILYFKPLSASSTSVSVEIFFLFLSQSFPQK